MEISKDGTTQDKSVLQQDNTVQNKSVLQQDNTVENKSVLYTLTGQKNTECGFN